jgi:hypothetical protein
MAMTDFHQDMLARAQQRLREARAEYETFAANMDPSDEDLAHMVALTVKLQDAERAVANAERALRGAQALQRAVALGM